MWYWCIKLICIAPTSLKQRTAGQAAVLQCCRGELHTLHCHDAAAVTTCHVSHVSTYPMVAGAGHRSGHAEKLQLWRILSGGLTLSRAAVTCAACGQQVTCHVSRVAVARLGQHHGHQVTPAAAGTCGHWWLAAPCAVVSGHHLVQPHCWWRGWDRSAVGQPVCGVAGGSPPAVVLAASLAAAYWHGLYWLQTAASRGPARR